jgi:hypothetical protein
MPVFAYDCPLWVGTLLSHPKTRASVCKKQFQEFDVDANGQLDEDELSKLCESVCAAMKIQPPSQEDLHAAFGKFDKSQSAGLTSAEFARFFEHLLRASLPLMVKPTPLKREISKPSPSTPAPSCGYNVSGPREAEDALRQEDPKTAGTVPRIANPGDVIVIVRNMSGEVVFGPSPIDPSEHVSALLQKLAKVTCKPSLALLLLQGHILLRPDRSLSVNEDEDQVELTMSVASPDHLLDAAVQALDECPRDEERWVPRPASGDEPWPEHLRWLQGGARVVQEQLNQLGQETAGCLDSDYKQAVCNFVLKVLDVPGCVQCRLQNQGFPSVWGTRKFQHVHGHDNFDLPPELYPEDLTWTAAKMLPRVVSAADPTVHAIILKWLQRLTSSYWTLNEILSNVPFLLADADRTMRRSALKELLRRAEQNIQSLPNAFNWNNWGTPGSKNRLECERRMPSDQKKLIVSKIETMEWTIVSSYWAVVGLWKDEDAPMVLDSFLKVHHVCNQKYKEQSSTASEQTWGDFFGIHPELNMHPWEMPQRKPQCGPEDEEGLQEYMYKRH